MRSGQLVPRAMPWAILLRPFGAKDKVFRPEGAQQDSPGHRPGSGAEAAFFYLSRNKRGRYLPSPWIGAPRVTGATVGSVWICGASSVTGGGGGT